MNSHRLPACLLVLLSTVVVGTAIGNDLHDYRTADARAVTTHYGASPGGAKADTVIVYGGPGTQEGKFELGDGTPDWGGWTSVDHTVQYMKWHIDTFNCANLGGGGPGNHAWWCGEVFEDDCGGTPEGYGNNWVERLDWVSTVANVDVDTEVCITWDMNWETEPGYDHLKLMLETGGGVWADVGFWEGTGTAIDTTMCFWVPAGDYAGESGDEVGVRFEFTSEGAWSDEDCLFPTDAGAVQLDDIEVRFDGVLQGVVEDCEGDVAPQWQVTEVAAVGDFAALWTALDDADPCRSNPSTVVAFIDNGQLEGLDGSLCISHCYGPGGYVVNITGGLAGEGFHLRNSVVSPVIAWPEGCDGARLDYDMYIHSDLTEMQFPGIFTEWFVRSTLDPTAESGWTAWKNDNFVDYGGPEWRREQYPVSAYLEPGRRWVQCRLGVYELGWIWCFFGDDATPAPYYDNVRLTGWAETGPVMTADEIDLAQDNFPTADTLDFENPGSNSIRFDMAMDIALPDHHANDPGDSIVVTVAPARTDSYLDALPQMCWLMKANPFFDGVRALPAGATQLGDRILGFVDADTVRTRADVGAAVIEGEWAFDLPDEGFFFPGDVIHYFFRATDMVDGVGQGLTLLPGDTTGFTDFSGPGSYNTAFTVRGLPTVSDPYDYGPEIPEVLFWNDYARPSVEDVWYDALAELSGGASWEYDVYCTRGASSGVSNGLGGRASVEHLAGYDVILYSAGDLAKYTLTNVDWDHDKGDDLGLLQSWLALGDKNMALFGDDIVFDLSSMYEGWLFTRDHLGLSLDNRDLRPEIDYQAAPTVRASGDYVFDTGYTPVTEWVAYGGCPSFNYFDAVLTTDAIRLAWFEDLNGDDTYPYAAASLNVDTVLDNDVIHMPYAFHLIQDPGLDPVPASMPAEVLNKILLYFTFYWYWEPWPGVPDHEAFVVECYPNPFNPSTKLAWSMPARAAMTIRIFNLRGNLVRTLIEDEMVEAAGSRTWNGRDDGGAQVASGVYFAKIQSGEYAKTLKVALVK